MMIFNIYVKFPFICLNEIPVNSQQVDGDLSNKRGITQFQITGTLW